MGSKNWAQRRICWPHPKAICLEGKCLVCNDYPFRNRSEIRKYVVAQGTWARLAWDSGKRNSFFGRAEMR